jgi:hypothetical protein
MTTKATWADLAVLDARIERMLAASTYRSHLRRAEASRPGELPAPMPPAPPKRDLRADTVRLIIDAGKFRRAEQDDDDQRRDTEPGSPPEPEPGSLVLDAIRRRQKRT